MVNNDIIGDEYEDVDKFFETFPFVVERKMTEKKRKFDEVINDGLEDGDEEYLPSKPSKLKTKRRN